jgi:MFS superfamily sulfate permease-like transporter
LVFGHWIFLNENTFSGIADTANHLSPATMIIGAVSLFILILWDRPFFKKQKVFHYIQGPLVVVIIKIFPAWIFQPGKQAIALSPNHLVNLPVSDNSSSFTSLFQFPGFEHRGNLQVWITGITLAVVASMETLLSIEAIDKLDPFKRRTPANCELKAQGVGNIISGFLGGLPLTSVIVRSSVNVNAGAKTKSSAVFHGILLLLAVFFITTLLNSIPLSALLVGILVGIGVGLFFLVRSNFHSAVMVVHAKHNYLFRLRKDVSFLNKPIVKSNPEPVTENSFVLIDLMRADFIDKDIIDTFNEFMQHAHLCSTHT